MKLVNTLKLAGCVVLAAASLHAQAQTTDQAASAPAAAADQQPQKAGGQSRATRATDRKLAHQVRAALTHDRHIAVANITVRARDGAVTLQGSVPEAAQIAHAADVAKGVSGVNSVKNALTLRPISS